MFRRDVEGATWLTHWKAPETLTMKPPEHDYRDRLPVRPEHIAEQYAPVVKVSPATNTGSSIWPFLYQSHVQRSFLYHSILENYCVGAAMSLVSIFLRKHCMPAGWNLDLWHGAVLGKAVQGGKGMF